MAIEWLILRHLQVLSNVLFIMCISKGSGVGKPTILCHLSVQQPQKNDHYDCGGNAVSLTIGPFAVLHMFC